MAAFPSSGLSGFNLCQVREGCLCVRRDGRSAFLQGGGWAALGQRPGPSPAPTAPRAPSTCPSPMGTAGQDVAGSGALRGPAPGRCPDRDRSSCQAWGGVVNPRTAEAGASLTPTLWTGTLRLGSCQDLAGSQGSEATGPGGPGPALWLPTGLHSRADPHRPPERLRSGSLETLTQTALGESLAGVVGGRPLEVGSGSGPFPCPQLQLHRPSLYSMGLPASGPLHGQSLCLGPPPQRGPP